jgi:hypothetical protein
MGVRRLYFALMAKQAGDIFITGTIDDLCFYKMDVVYYVRLKSSLTGKKFWKNKAFEGSRKSCNRFAEGNKLASKVYQMIEEEKRVYKLYCFLKRRAILLLKEGKTIDEAQEVLVDCLVEFGYLKKQRNKIIIKGKNAHAYPPMEFNKELPCQNFQKIFVAAPS